jgi:hypothetical protein
MLCVTKRLRKSIINIIEVNDIQNPQARLTLSKLNVILVLHMKQGSNANSIFMFPSDVEATNEL